MQKLFEKISLDNDCVDILYTNLICQKQWVYFFWEKGYLEN